MSFEPNISQSEVFNNFKSIDAQAYRNIVRYYERHEKVIELLEFEEYFELLLAYSNALFEICEYKKHIKLSKLLIETSVVENITHFRGEEVYMTALLKKAISHYYTFQFEQSEHILKEMLKINAQDSDVVRVLSHVYRDNPPRYLRWARALSILFFLTSAIVISLEVLVIRHFFESLTPFVEWARNILFASGVGVYVLCEVWHRWQVARKVRFFLKHCTRKEAVK